MASPPPFTGYKPGVELPIIAPPLATDPAAALAFYQQLQIQISLAASGPNGEFIDISLAKAGVSPLDATLFAMTGGFVRFYAAGATIPSPDNFVDAARDILMLTTWLGDVEAQQRRFPPDTPPIGHVYYVGVDQPQTALILRAETAKMSEAALRASWKAAQSSAAPPSTTIDALVDAHNLRVMGGTGSVFVTPGTAIGRAAEAVGTTVETYTFTLRTTTCGPPVSYVSPLPVFKGAPYYDLSGEVA